MVGSGIKKYAEKNRLTVKNGVAYGVYRGYMMTLQEGSGWKSADFAICVSEERCGVLQGQLGRMLDEKTKKEYRIMAFGVSTRRITVRFFDNPGTMGKMEAFIDLLCDELSGGEVPGQNYCTKCGQPIDSLLQSEEVMVEGAVFQMHSGCADSMAREMDAAREEKQSQGNMATGIIGAVLGGIIGAIPWAIVSYLGAFVGWLGFLIGFAAKKGYELLKGKECKAKAVVIILVAILAVLLAEVAGWTVAFMTEGATMAEGVQFTFYLLSADSEFQAQVAGNIVLGLIFAGLGIFDVVREIFSANSKKNTSVTKM